MSKSTIIGWINKKKPITEEVKALQRTDGNWSYLKI
jgi:hypothetical protein